MRICLTKKKIFVNKTVKIRENRSEFFKFLFPQQVISHTQDRVDFQEINFITFNHQIIL